MSLIIEAQKTTFGTIQTPINSRCPICFMDWQNQNKVTKLVCGHIYCDRTGCLEDITRLANSKCALCRAPIKIDEEKKQTVFSKLVHTGRRISTPNYTPTEIEYAIQHVRLYGTNEANAKLDQHEAVMAEKERQEDISKRVLLVVAPILGVVLAALSYYFLQK